MAWAAVRVAASAGAGGVPAERLSLLSPVTTPCRVVAQAVNYRSHAQDAGVGDDPPPVFFRKSSASVSAPTGDVIRPAHVRLLDYELEVGLVMGHQLPVGAAVTDADLPGYVAAVVMCNDFSARDVQLEKGQFYESKSYPTFTPTGPRLVLLDADDFGRLAAAAAAAVGERGAAPGRDGGRHDHPAGGGPERPGPVPAAGPG